MITETVFTKQHYIDQMKYICQCIMNAIAHNIEEIIVDNFAGGGGASTGIEMATGYSVYAAINHDPEAIKMHMTNHPSTKHFCESVWDVDPIMACDGKPVGLAWFSPDCKHFSKAKGGKPKDKSIRGLAWVALRWAGTVRPRVIMLENVEEFKTWGPLNRSHRPIKEKQGTTFNKFVSQLQDLGYQVEFKELVAADYGTPTMRKRFFMIARCDGQPITWPEPTHAPRESEEVKTGSLQPYVGAHTQIDFSRPCPSIFDSAEDIKNKYGVRAQRPLASKTMQRIARGLQKFVIDNADPFIVQVNHSGSDWHYTNNVKDPLPVITAKHGFGVVEPYIVQCKYDNDPKDLKNPLGTITTVGSHLLAEPYIVPIGYGERRGQEPRIHDINEPLPTIVSSGKHYVCEPKLQQIDERLKSIGLDDNEENRSMLRLLDITNDNDICQMPYISVNRENHFGSALEEPIHTVTSNNQHMLMTPTLIQYHSETISGEVRGQGLTDPIMTVDGSNRYGLVSAFIQKYFDGGYKGAGADLEAPLPTVTSVDHNSICAVNIVQLNNNCDGIDVKEPLPTVTAGGGHFGEVRSFLERYYSDESNRSDKKTNKSRNNPCQERREVLEDIKPTMQPKRNHSSGTKDNGSKIKNGVYGNCCMELWKTVSNACAQGDVGNICRGDTSGDGYKPQEREQTVQQFEQSGSDDEKSKSETRNRYWSESLQQLSRSVFRASEEVKSKEAFICENRQGTGDISNGGIQGGEFQANTLIKYYGQGTGQDIKAPLDTITANDRFGLVTIKGVDYAIVDIGLRMLEPRELYGCQGFPEDYIIDHDSTGKAYPRSEQVKRCGNAVCPPIPAALVRSNLPELCRGERMPNMRIDDSHEQLRFA